MVLVGNFSLGSTTTFVSGWSYTGYGAATVLHVTGGTRNVAGNTFYRLVFDLNHVHEGRSFSGDGALGFYNVVIRDQHSNEGTRELLYATSSTAYLTLENCLLYDVEWNVWVIGYQNNYQITNTVSSNCDSKFTLASQAPSVTVNMDYSINGGNGDGQGVYKSGSTYTFSIPTVAPSTSGVCVCCVCVCVCVCARACGFVCVRLCVRIGSGCLFSTSVRSHRHHL